VKPFNLLFGELDLFRAQVPPSFPPLSSLTAKTGGTHFVAVRRAADSAWKTVGSVNEVHRFSLFTCHLQFILKTMEGGGVLGHRISFLGLPPRSHLQFRKFRPNWNKFIHLRPNLASLVSFPLKLVLPLSSLKTEISAIILVAVSLQRAFRTLNERNKYS